jgi:hypothetical protein
MSANETRRVTRPGRYGPEPANALLICSDLLDLCDQPGVVPSRGRGSLRDAVREAERRRNRGQREAQPTLR